MMSANVVHMPTRRKPRTFTKGEEVMLEVQERIHMCGMTYTVIADKTGVAPSTIQNIATGKTRWPRPTTLFPLFATLGMRMWIETPNGDKEVPT